MVEYVGDDEMVRCSLRMYAYIYNRLIYCVVGTFQCFGSHCFMQPPFRALIPKIMDVIKTLVCEDEVELSSFTCVMVYCSPSHFFHLQDKACEAMELFDELVECDVAIVMPHLIPLIQFCLDLAANAQLGNNLRVKALSFVSWLVTLKKKVRFPIISQVMSCEYHVTVM